MWRMGGRRRTCMQQHSNLLPHSAGSYRDRNLCLSHWSGLWLVKYDHTLDSFTHRSTDKTSVVRSAVRRLQHPHHETTPHVHRPALVHYLPEQRSITRGDSECAGWKHSHYALTLPKGRREETALKFGFGLVTLLALIQQTEVCPVHGAACFYTSYRITLKHHPAVDLAQPKKKQESLLGIISSIIFRLLSTT